MDQCPPDATIAVGERVDRLELGVGERRLDQRSVQAAVDIADEVVHQLRYQRRWWRNELSVERVPGAPADPVLARAQSVHLLVGKQRAVQGQHAVDGDRGCAREGGRRVSQQRDVVGDEGCVLGEARRPSAADRSLDVRGPCGHLRVERERALSKYVRLIGEETSALLLAASRCLKSGFPALFQPRGHDVASFDESATGYSLRGQTLADWAVVKG